ncbi:MAG: SET domain-containing protein [Gammaproteobacteria bacterium]
MKTLNQLTYVSHSKIHGHGLFARKSIPRDYIIGRIQGKPCTRDGTYVLWLNEKEGFRVSCNLKYINHSDTPNACYYDDLTVVALREIDQDEEITHNYASSDW